MTLFEKTRFSFGPDQGAFTYSVSPDGKRFLISTPGGSSAGFAQELTLLVNPAQLR